MSKQIENKILQHLKSETYRPQKRRGLAKELQLASDEEYQQFKDALAVLMHEGRVIYGAGGTIVLPGSHARRDENDAAGDASAKTASVATRQAMPGEHAAGYTRFRALGAPRQSMLPTSRHTEPAGVHA